MLWDGIRDNLIVFNVTSCTVEDRSIDLFYSAAIGVGVVDTLTNNVGFALGVIGKIDIITFMTDFVVFGLDSFFIVVIEHIFGGGGVPDGDSQIVVDFVFFVISMVRRNVLEEVREDEFFLLFVV